MTDLETIGVLVKALELIEASPAHWDQSTWHCGTSHCLAGFCDIVNDFKLDGEKLLDVDLKLIEYDANVSNFSQANPKLRYLFKSGSSLQTLRNEIASLVEHGEIEGYDSYGYDSYGYDSDGYDSDGYDRYGIKSEER